MQSPIIHILRTDILPESSDDTELTVDMKTHSRDYMNNKCSDPTVPQLLDPASVLDHLFGGSYVAREEVICYLMKVSIF